MPQYSAPLKRLPFYRELRQAYHSYKTYHKLFPYLINRFWVAPKITRASRPLGKLVDTDLYTIHVLCSHSDLLAMLWTLGSWYAVAKESARAYIHDDGTLTPDDQGLIGRLFPGAKIVDRGESARRAGDDWLKAAPAANRFRQNPKNFYAVKLMDPVCVSPAPHLLVMDTDILWFAAPDDLASHIATYQAAVFWPSSGKPSRQMFRDGSELRHDLAALNSGIVYFSKASFEIGTLEEYCQRLDPDALLLDQPGFAYVLGERGAVTTLPKERYPIHGPAGAQTVAKHYTGPRREQFWFEGVARLRSTLIR